VDISARKKAEAALVQARDELELRVAERTSNLTATNLQLHREVADREAAEMALVTEQMLLRRLLNLQEHDRKLVAYDIHDGLVQYITAALMQLEAFAQVAQAPEAARDKFASAVQMLRNTIAEARRLISGLRPPILDESGIVPAIEYLLHEQSHPAVEFTHDVQDDRLSPPVEGALFRVCQEAVTNARKYSQANLIQVSLVQDRYRIRLEIRDDGVGFDPSTVRGKKFGLQGIRERARLLGGRVKIESSANAGTLVAVDLPI
jgi:signal transduction histidine kinase